MTPARIYEEFRLLAERLEIRLLVDRGNFSGDYCVVGPDKYIVLNKHKPIEQRLKRFAAAFSQLDLNNMYIKPALRELIEAARIEKI